MDARTKKLLIIQSLVILGGAVFAWSKLIPQLRNFLELYGTLFRFTGCAVPNPLLTACFWGSAAFLVALFWSISVYQRPTYTSQRWLRNFLFFGVVFAASVVSYEALTFYKFISASTVAVTCTPGVAPTQTPCFTGMLFFIAAFTFSVSVTRRLKLISNI